MSDRNEEGLLEENVKTKRYRGKYCVAYGCKQRSDEGAKKRGITFHAFPWSKPDLVRKWERAMHRKEFKATVHSRVCSNHFTRDCFDRSGSRVRIRDGAVPSVFDLPGHPARHVQHRKSPAEESNGRELTAPKAPESTTLLASVEHNCAPVRKPSFKRLRYSHLINPTNGLISIGSKDIIPESNLPIKPFKHQISELKVCDGHNYSLPSPRVLLNKFSLMEAALARYKHNNKILRQQNQRLQRKLESLQRQPPCD